MCVIISVIIWLAVSVLLVGVKGVRCLMDVDVYVRFKYEEDAQKAVDELNQRFYAGRPLWAELSPVTDFRECNISIFVLNICNSQPFLLACCRQYDMGECTRAGLCNFMHLKRPSRGIKSDLAEAQRKSLRILKKDSGKHDERSRSRERRRSRDRRRSRSRERSYR